MKNTLLFMVLAAGLSFLLCAGAAADIIYVNGETGSDDNDGPSPDMAKSTIQAGIDAALDGETVFVADGTYMGEGNRDIDFCGKAITVRSEHGAESCIIDCGGSEEEYHRGFCFHSGEDPKSILDGFTIKNGYYRDGGGIYCDSGSSPIIENNIISNNLASYRGGRIR